MTQQPKDNDIVGVLLKPLKTHGDQRGFFREIVRSNDPFFFQNAFAQWSHSKMQKDVVKAWHYHHVQYDWWYVALGQLQVVLYDYREESPTFKTKLEFKLGDEQSFGPDTLAACVCIPPGVLHGCRVLSSEAHLFYITSQTYDPNEEGRIAYNSDLIPHNWGSGAITVENDRRNFIPTSIRKLIKA